MVELVTADRPDVVCLQEVPLWALPQLGRWSGMSAVGAEARPSRVRSPRLGHRITSIHHGIFRSAFTGEAGAILVEKRFRIGDERRMVVNEVGLRRIVHSVRLDDDLVIANFHIAGEDTQWRVVESYVAQFGRVVAAGDANIPGASLSGFSAPLPGSIDQILVKGVPSTAPARWPDELRRLGGRLLSDHAPVELSVG